MAAPGVTLVKKFVYRGHDEEWSNQYHFVGTAPSTDAAWRTLVDGLILKEKLCLSNTITILRAYCYTNTDNPSVYTYDLATFSGTVPGSLNSSGQILAPGDAAAWVRWKTNRVTSRGKPIYLRKYFHGVWLSGLTGDAQDQIQITMNTALGTFGTSVLGSASGWPGMAGPDGVTPGAVLVSPFVTTRTLKRRGGRP